MGNDGKSKNWFKRHRLLVTFVLGAAGGVIGTILGPGVVRPYVPEAIREDPELVRGVVRTKQFERDRLLLTVPTGKGTILATFTEEVSEIDILVLEGDSVTLALSEYAPFVENPSIARVVSRRSSTEEGVLDEPAAAGRATGVTDTVSQPHSGVRQDQ